MGGTGEKTFEKYFIAGKKCLLLEEYEEEQVRTWNDI